MIQQSSSDAQRATAARDEVQRLNDNALMALCAQYAITLPRNAKDWRPTVRTSGNIPGFEREFIILTTDGVVAWYIDHADVLFYGHTQHFTGKIRPLHSVESPAQAAAGRKERKPKGAKKPSLTLAAALEALRSLAK